MSSFGFGSGGSGGFGQNNQQQQQQPATAFGGFGAANNNPSGFGATGNNAFGANNTTSAAPSLFGGNAAGNPGFGSGTAGGFGGGNTAFGAAKPAFGAPATTTASGSLFGSTTTAAGTGGFGAFGTNNAANNNTAANSSFGGGSGLFGNAGVAKSATPAFGNTNNAFGSTGSSLFSGGNTGAGLGANANTTAGFGATGNPGLGTNVGEPPGTAVVAFAPFTEKESNSASSTTNSFQSILFMDAYKKWSFEELRLADYSQGRRHGNVGGTGTFGGSTFGTGATGGFGTTNTSSGFGGAAAGGGLFANAQPSSGFGAATNTGGFGSTANTAGGGLFGASKPNTMFGGGTNNAQQTGTSLFGGGGTTGAGFGAANTTNNAFGSANNTTGGGLFGSSAAKPSGFGSFGNANNTQAPGAFGSNTTQPGGFGAANTTSTGSGLFGNANQGTNTTAAGSNLFGNANTQQQQPANAFGGGTAAFGQAAQPSTGLNLFGQQKPSGGLFGSTPTANTAATGTGMFGNAGTQNAFGAPANQNNASTGVFGKPAGTGTGLFGAPVAAQTGNTGSLFGSLGANNQTQQPAQISLFGSLGQNNQAKPSLFGQPAATGGGLFGQSATQPQPQGMFGSTLQQAQQPGLGGSLFGGTNNQAAPQALATSINDPSAFGSTSLFANLTDDKTSTPGPLATPLSDTAKARSRSILPVYRLSPATANKFATPQKRAGFGFSYSTYGSPSSPSSVASTPGGLGQSLLLASTNRGLSKSISTSSLRRSYNIEDSILAPGAFSTSTGPKLLPTAASHKKLVINKEIRSDLFSSTAKDRAAQEQANGSARKLSKRVSFDTEPAEASANGNTGKAIEAAPEKPLETNKSSLGSPDHPQPSSHQSNGMNGGGQASAATPEMQQVKGNELAIVHEEASPASFRRSSKTGDNIEPGAYWMHPPENEIDNMSIRERQKVYGFTVGRENVGSIQFKVPVDLTGIKLDELYDNIVVLTPRSATVYPITAKKPPPGKGLNMPALISLEHSFPRGGPSTTGRKLERHLERLRSIPDTKFEKFDRENGVWTFSVEHFTTYGLDESDDDDDADETLPNPDVEVVTKRVRPTDSVSTYTSPAEQTSSPDVGVKDTPDFKRSRRSAVPGAFDEDALYVEEASSHPNPSASKPSFLLSGAFLPVAAPAEDDSMADEDDIYEQAELMALPSPQGSGGEQDHHDNQLALARSAADDGQVPGGIMRARMRAFKRSTAPTKIEVAGGNDWTQILQESVRAPRTVDRATLRALNESGAVWEAQDQGSPVPLNKNNKRIVSDGGFATSIDLMKSLFEQSKGPTQLAEASPSHGFVKWPYQKRDKDEAEDGVPVSRPSWGPNGRLVTTVDDQVTIATVDIGILDDGLNNPTQLALYMDSTSSSAMSRDLTGPSLREMARGDAAWELAALLFENNSVDLTAYWRQIVSDATDNAIKQAPSAEEKALAALSGHRVADACAFLLAGKDFRLANLVSCIGVNTKDMRAQIQDWRDSNVLSEFSDSIRALYELLAGNACTCTGIKNVPIENRASSFVISQRFGLDWMRSFGLRLFYSTPSSLKGGSNLTAVTEAVRSFEADIEQDREPEPDSPIWTLLKIFATRRFDWADYAKLGWLITRAIYATGKVSFAESASAEKEKLDAASIAFASALTAQGNGNWVAATFVLLHISDPVHREAAVRDHLGRHAHLIGAPRSSSSRQSLSVQPRTAPSSSSHAQQKQQQQLLLFREGTFSALRRLGVPESWIWEAKALDFRARQDSRQEFLALVWAGCHAEASRTFVERLAPGLVIARDLDRLFGFAELLYRVRGRIPDWDHGAAVYMLYPMALQQQLGNTGGVLGGGASGSGGGSWQQQQQQNQPSKDALDSQLLDGLASLHAAVHDDGDVRRRAALSDMAEQLIKCRGGDARLYQMLPRDVRERYLRRRALEGMC